MAKLTRRSLLTGAAALGAAASTGGLVWKPRRASAQATPTPASAFNDLRQRLNGTLILPGDSAYDSASAPANGRYLDIRPAAIARCADEADVVTCVN